MSDSLGDLLRVRDHMQSGLSRACMSEHMSHISNNSVRIMELHVKVAGCAETGNDLQCSKDDFWLIARCMHCMVGLYLESKANNALSSASETN